MARPIMQHVLLLPPATQVDPTRVHRALEVITGLHAHAQDDTIPLSFNFPLRHPFTFLPRRLSFSSPVRLQQAVLQMPPHVRRKVVTVAWGLPLFVAQPEIPTVLLVPYDDVSTTWTHDAVRTTVVVWVDAAMAPKDAARGVRHVVRDNASRGRTVLVRMMQEGTKRCRLGATHVWPMEWEH